MMFTAPLVVLAAICNVVYAAPSAEAGNVWAPVITYPHHGTIWYTGQRHNVTWDASHPPMNLTNSTGEIWLRKSGVNTKVLAQGFNLTLGRIEVTVPSVKSGTNYKLVLYGDSSNTSQNFAIKN
ncbi:hypothetical protein C8Q80DRAFT_756086 [Daedaleopsis nitida]|nr:hypothetical protein C8Q80DRAFT_756086 [Daedaleopsis nitida]